MKVQFEDFFQLYNLVQEDETLSDIERVDILDKIYECFNNLIDLNRALIDNCDVLRGLDEKDNEADFDKDFLDIEYMVDDICQSFEMMNELFERYNIEATLIYVNNNEFENVISQSIILLNEMKRNGLQRVYSKYREKKRQNSK